MTSVKASKLEGLVAQFYEAAMQPTLWRTALRDTADALGADGAAIFSNPVAPSIGLHCSDRVDELVDWVQRQGPLLHNPRPERALQKGRPGKAITESELFSDWELKHLPFNAGMVDEVGLRWDAGGNVGDVAGQPVFMTVQREADKERFQRPELDALEALFPHVRRAASMAVFMAQARALGMLDTFSSIGCGAVLLDFLGRPLRFNEPAERLVGETLRIERAQLVAKDPAANRQFQRVIGAALAPSPLGKRDRIPVAALPRRNGRPVLVQGMPVSGASRDLFHRAKAIILLKDPDVGSSPDDSALRELFKLTPAEVRVASALALGDDLSEIAARLNISLGTARAQLKSIMAKTDTHRQAELAVLIARVSRTGRGT